MYGAVRKVECVFFRRCQFTRSTTRSSLNRSRKPDPASNDLTSIDHVPLIRGKVTILRRLTPPHIPVQQPSGYAIRLPIHNLT